METINPKYGCMVLGSPEHFASRRTVDAFKTYGLIWDGTIRRYEDGEDLTKAHKKTFAEAFGIIKEKIALVSSRDEIPTDGIVFPYYANADMSAVDRANLKSEIARTLATLYVSDYPFDASAAGVVRGAIKFTSLINIKYLYQAELDEIYLWCNPIRQLPGRGMCLYGYHYYLNGRMIRGTYNIYTKRPEGITTSLLDGIVEGIIK